MIDCKLEIGSLFADLLTSRTLRWLGMWRFFYAERPMRLLVVLVSRLRYSLCSTSAECVDISVPAFKETS